jgi:hypothetical protein
VDAAYARAARVQRQIASAWATASEAYVVIDAVIEEANRRLCDPDCIRGLTERALQALKATAEMRGRTLGRLDLN